MKGRSRFGRTSESVRRMVSRDAATGCKRPALPGMRREIPPDRVAFRFRKEVRRWTWHTAWSG